MALKTVSGKIFDQQLWCSLFQRHRRIKHHHFGIYDPRTVKARLFLSRSPRTFTGSWNLTFLLRCSGANFSWRIFIHHGHESSKLLLSSSRMFSRATNSSRFLSVFRASVSSLEMTCIPLWYPSLLLRRALKSRIRISMTNPKSYNISMLEWKWWRECCPILARARNKFARFPQIRRQFSSPPGFGRLR